MSWSPPALPPGLPQRSAAPLEQWRAAMLQILARHSLSSTGLRPEPTGTAIVWSTDTAVVKLTQPRWAADIEGEARGCHHCSALSVQVPAELAQGELSGWPYVVLSRLPGVALDQVWPALSPTQRCEAARNIGAMVAELQALPPPSPAPSWPAFLEQRIKAAASLPGPPLLVAAIPGLLRRAGPHLRAPVVFLHTELLGAHVLVDPAAPTVPTGLIDFAEAMVGHPALELGALVDFLFHDEAGLLAAFFEGYGDGPLAALADDAEALLGAYLVHQYASLPRLLGGLSRQPGSLEELAELCFRR